jgi:drug/metabolite transporter (DMT)-like permease
MSLEGGHWVWSAALRYFWMTALFDHRPTDDWARRLLRDALRLFRKHWRFWLVAGTIGFGVFYAGVTFAASFAPGWVVATTWQITVLASPLVLLAYGRRVPLRGVAFHALIFLGIVLVNVGQIGASGLGR